MVNKVKQLVVIGDSSVYGWGDSIGGGWCERLRQNWMITNGKPIIYSLGIRGDGLEKVAKRWNSEWSCRGELRRTLPSGVLLSIGLNDTARVGRPDGRPQLSTEAFRFGFEEMLKKIKKNTFVMVMGLTPVKEEKMPFAECLWYTNHASSIYERLIEESCLELDIPFLPTFKQFHQQPTWESLISDDGIHLNSVGHNWLYERVNSWQPLISWSNDK